MKTLLIVRHGKSSWKDKTLADKDRPLKKRGIRESEYLGKMLIENELIPQVILSSPAVRARKTAEIIAKTFDAKDKVTLVKSFYMAEPDAYVKGLSELPDAIERVMIVGHNPGLEALLQLLDGKVEALPTGSLAYLILNLLSWAEINADISGELIGFWRLIEEEPKEEETEPKPEHMDKHPRKDEKMAVKTKPEHEPRSKKGDTDMGDKKDKKGKKDKKDKKEKKGKKDKK